MSVLRSRAHVAATVAVLIACAVILTGARFTSGDGYVSLDVEMTQLRRAFNDDAGKVRLVLGVSPTCASCLRRAAMTQKQLLEAFRDPGLVAHVVWLPTHGARERHVPEATRLLENGRATHYWDGHDSFMDLFEEPLSERPGDAEGVVMLYGPAARWSERTPPTPEAWVYEARDVRTLREPVRRLLGRDDR